MAYFPRIPYTDTSDLDPTLVDHVKQFEGFTPKAQWDYKQYTNGYGTLAQHPGETIDRNEADSRLQDELWKASRHVDGLGVPMTPGQRNALTSLTFNAGPGWINSGLGAAVRAGDWDTAEQHLLQYNKAGGKFNQGLADRRAAEAAWMSGDPEKKVPK